MVASTSVRNTFTFILPEILPPTLSDHEIWTFLVEFRTNSLVGSVGGHESAQLVSDCQSLRSGRKALLFCVLVQLQRGVSNAWQLSPISLAARSTLAEWDASISSTGFAVIFQCGWESFPLPVNEVSQWNGAPWAGLVEPDCLMVQSIAGAPNKGTFVAAST